MYFKINILLFVLGIVLGGPGDAWGAAPGGFPQGDGRLRLYNFQSDQFAEVGFRENGKLLPEGVARIQELLRSRVDSETVTLDIRLLDLLDYLQDYFGADTVEIISGLHRKTPSDPKEKRDREPSPQGLHAQGKAVDFHLDEIREETIRNYLVQLKIGGVGYYGSLDFIHVGSGKFRTWGGSEAFARQLMGIMTPEGPVKLISDKNEYLPGDYLNFVWEFAKGFALKKVRNIQLERFWRGKWVPCRTPPPQPRHFVLPAADLSCPAGMDTSPYGKFRWTFGLKGNEQRFSSNEFYLKKE